MTYEDQPTDTHWALEHPDEKNKNKKGSMDGSGGTKHH